MTAPRRRLLAFASALVVAGSVALVSASTGNPQNGTGRGTVYVTRTGTKYQRAGCRSLSRSQIPITLKDAVGGYGPCSICRPPTLAAPPANVAEVAPPPASAVSGANALDPCDGEPDGDEVSPPRLSDAEGWRHPDHVGRSGTPVRVPVLAPARLSASVSERGEGAAFAPMPLRRRPSRSCCVSGGRP